MKKFVLAFGIPVLAVASLIGSGYATWYFNSNVVTDKNDIALELKEKRVVGAEFRHSGETSLVLDQPDYTKTDGMPAGRKGVHFEGTFSESLAANGDANMFVKGTSYTVTTTITIPSGVAEYVDFTFDGHTSSTTNLTLTKVSTLEVVSEKQSAFDFFNISEVTVAYTAKEPKDSAQYDAMKTAVTGNINISFAAVIDTTTK